MADPKSRFLKFASKAVPTAFLGGIGLVLAGNLLDNAYRRFVQTPEELAEKIRSGDHKPNVFLDIRSGKYVALKLESIRSFFVPRCAMLCIFGCGSSASVAWFFWSCHLQPTAEKI